MKKLVCLVLVLLLAGCIPIGLKSSTLPLATYNAATIAENNIRLAAIHFGVLDAALPAAGSGTIVAPASFSRR